MNLKILIYCTKAKSKYYNLHKTKKGIYYPIAIKENLLNGKILAECDFEVEEVTKEISSVVEEWYSKGLLKKSCLNAFELDDYLKGQKGYAIHIKDLHVFDKPKELKDFYIKGAYHNAEQMFTDEIQINGEWYYPIKKAPQNMCYAYDSEGKKYVVMSTQPKWVMYILNGLKTIEVRRKVLKEMKEYE